MDSELTQALKYTAVINIALFVISIIFVVVIGSIPKIIAFSDKHGVFRRRGRMKQAKKDIKKNVIIAAAIESYLQAEQERKR